ncbi:hypothetical protein BD410DRAFT_893124 [Rickenella mellea]|uniref:Fungal-type protein kinase domain-containing protein n=1 Tax=Rickenella mellea TaxID=50990 RepID=A0A4R5XFM2_9AGAM|nr:hypothetical protein BD410DRAFT_893124 [Rickenella mellea]
MPTTKLQSRPRKISSGIHSSKLIHVYLPTVPRGLRKVIVKNELIQATWESETALSTFQPYNSDVVQDVVTRLIPYRSSVFSRRSRRKPGAWPRERPEDEYYNPFVLLLNKALEAARKELGCASGNYYDDLQFSVYDRQVEDTDDQAHPFEPGLVGCVRTVGPEEKLNWNEIMVPITVKPSWRELVEQALKYARSLFATSAREFALVISFNYKTTEVRFLFFHRSGLTSSPPVQLNTEKGWIRFIEGIVGLASVRDRSGAGMETSRDTSSYHLPWFGLCKIEELHYTMSEVTTAA